MQLKLQSAMEYMMTYGWAVLVLVVVLAAMFQLGLFNPSTFAPKAPPGSCKVVRPNGAGTTAFISLQGSCNGELPQYVLSAVSGSVAITTPAVAAFEPSSFTISMWFYQQVRAPGCYPGAIGVYSGYTQGYQVLLSCVNDVSAPGITVGNAGVEHYQTVGANNYEAGNWAQFVASFDGNTLTTYLDGQKMGSTAAGGITYTGVNSNFYIFHSAANDKTFFSNLQLYNNSLSANDINTLYLEGIGGAPVNLHYLVAWWPLNGNAKDYSGNGYDGTETSAAYSSSWANAYSAP